MRTTLRSFWIGRRGEWWSVAVAMASGGDGDSRVARGRESGEGERAQESEGERQGDAWRLRGVEEEDDVGNGAPRLPASHGLVEMKKKARRFFWRHR